MACRKASKTYRGPVAVTRGSDSGLEQLSRQARATSDKSGPPWGRWLRYIEVDSPKGEVVMEGPDNRPLLILNHEGDGRVALLASDQAWLWSRGFEGGGPQQELLRRLAHWLMKEPQLEEEALTADVSGTEVTVTRRTMTDSPRTVTVTAPDGSTASLALPQVQPGLYRSILKAPAMGLYRLKEGDLERVFVVGPASPRDYENAVATPDLLGPIATATNGGVLRLEAGIPSIRQVREGRPAFGRGSVGVTPREAYRTVDLRLRPRVHEFVSTLGALDEVAHLLEGAQVGVDGLHELESGSLAAQSFCSALPLPADFAGAL